MLIFILAHTLGYRKFVSQLTNTISDDLTILQVNRTQEKPRALRKVLSKLDVRRQSIVIVTLS